MRQQVLVLALLSVLLSTCLTQNIKFEQGSDFNIHWAESGGHILQAGSAVPRNVDVVVKFKNRYSQAPMVLVATSKLDWEKFQPAGFDLSVIETKTDSFTYRVTAVAPTQLYGIEVQYAVFQDPNIALYEFATSGTAELATGDSKKRPMVVPFKFEKGQYEENPVAAVFITGAQFTAKNNIVSMSVSECKKTGFSVKVETWYISKVTYFRFTAIVGTKDVLYASFPTFRVPNFQHEFAVKSPARQRDYLWEEQIKNPAFHTGNRKVFYGFRGFDQDINTNMRSYLNGFELGKADIKLNTGIWWDSVQYQVDASFFIYIPKITERVYIPGCAYIFSDCGFEGDVMEICDRENSFPNIGWNKPVKSFKVPEGKVLKVYDKENLKGRFIRVEQDNECIEVIQFTFLELLSALVE